MIQSPLNYTGGKYKLLPQILPLFPKDINCFVDLFCGGCNVGINVCAKKYVYNDSCEPLINLYSVMQTLDSASFIEKIETVIKRYGLSDVKLYGYDFYNCNSSDGLGVYNLCLALINPRLCKKLSIKVAVEQHDTKTAVPYLHVFLDNTWNLKNCAFIRLDKPEYVPEKNSKRLSTKQKEELIYILTRECNGNWIASIIDKSNIKAATGYETAVQTWIDTYEGNNKIQYDKNGFPVMPDYTRL